MEENLVCFRYECPRHPKCALAGGTCCAMEVDHRKTPLAAGACTQENGYRYFQPLSRNEVLQWMRSPLTQ